MEIKKIIFVVSSLNSGGIENYLLRFLTFFDGKIEPIILCKNNTFGELEEDYLKIKGIQLIKMRMGYLNPISIYKMHTILKTNKIDSICDFTGNFAGLVLWVSKLAGIKTRISFYRGSSNHFKETKVKLLYNLIMLQLVKWNATQILSNSYAALDYFYSNRNKSDARFKVIYNGIDAVKFESSKVKFKKEDFSIPSNCFVIGHTGRYNSAKNHDTIIKVAEKLCAKYNDIYFMLCGKDTDIFLKETILKNDILKDKVKILGYRNDVQSLLPVFDVYFFPSITEGQPNALIEAMITGLPIVASNIKPIIETTPVIIHKELIEPLNIDGFCEKIEGYYLSKQKREISNYSSWAKNKFNPTVLFNQFYNEL